LWSCVCVSLPRSFPPIGSIGTFTWCLKIRDGAAWRETDEGETDVSAVIEDLLTGQYDHPLRVVVFNAAERRSRDATEDIAEELDRRISAEGREVSEALQEFIEGNIGRKMGVQLDLPLRLWGRHGQK
jgi:hypothetical protein